MPQPPQCAAWRVGVAVKRRVRVGVAWVVSIAIAGLVGWWASGEALTPPEDPLVVSEPVTYRVVTGEIGRSRTLVALAEWPSTAVVLNQASGTLTSIPGTGSAAVGDVLYMADERPVVAGLGAVPAYRDMKRGDEGEDVRQLQSMLVELGFLEKEPDGKFGSGTRTAVRAWQKSLAVTVDGTVVQGDIVWFPELPARYLLSDGLTVGAQLSGGEQIMLLGDEPRVWIPIGLEQRNQIPDQAQVRVSVADGVWEGVIAEVVALDVSEAGDFDLLLRAVTGGPICGMDCTAQIPAAGRSEYRVEIVLVPTVAGPVVPASAVITRPDGSSYITTADGEDLPVTVLGAQGSLLLVDGIEIGVDILVFGDGE